MIVEFEDRNGMVAHKQFQEWRQKHPNGYYLTFGTKTKATLHGATACMHPGDVYWMPEDTKESRGAVSSLTKKRKVCSDLQAELLSFAEEHGLEITRCSHCY
jgi:hypothetical protein